MGGLAAPKRLKAIPPPLWAERRNSLTAADPFRFIRFHPPTMPQTQQRQPQVGDAVIVVRCDTRPALCGELAVIVGMKLDGSEYRLKSTDDGFEWDAPRGDFILRPRRA